MQPAGYNIDADLAYFANLYQWIKAHAETVSPSDTTFSYVFPAKLKVIVVPPDITQIKMQTAANPALFVPKPTKMVQSTEFMYQEWSDFLKAWRGPGEATVPDPVIETGCTILARGHVNGPTSLSAAQLCMDAAIVWHEAGHATAIAIGNANTEGYAYEFEVCALTYAIANNALAAFGFDATNVVEYLEQHRIGQFVTNSGQQKPRVKAALTLLRDELNRQNQAQLAGRVEQLAQQL
jgi:hypothetical protein